MGNVARMGCTPLSIVSTSAIGMTAFALLGCSSNRAAQSSVQSQLEDPKAANVAITGHVIEPKQVEPTDDKIASLIVPDGFVIEKWAEDLGKPRMILAMPDGTVYVTRREPGDCLMLKDTDGDGRADVQQVVAQKENLHGIAISPDGKTMYFAAIREVYTAEIQSDGSLGELTEIMSGLPDAGQHPNRTMAFGPDGKLYLSVGSTANATDEKNPEAATMLLCKPDGSAREVFASGLRNTIGFGWHPETGEMWGADHGIDWLGDDDQPEEFNKLEKGKKYGWPWIYADGRFNPQDDPPEGKTMEDLAAESEEPVVMYTAHSAPLQMTFYTGEMFPDEFQNDAFIAMRGSWNRNPPSGYELVRVRFDEAGQATEIVPFITGFLMEDAESPSGWSHLGRLAGLAQQADGSLLLSDDTNGVIYRISYENAVE